MQSKIDILGNGFEFISFELPKDADGDQNATLIFRNSTLKATKAVLYIHGFIDYFFQTEMADHFNTWGFNFYAVDLRKYGRSLQNFKHPNFINNIHEYFTEIDFAINEIRKNGNEKIVLVGHSTGGLTSSLYAHHHKNIDGLILNSPFFDLNVPRVVKTMAPFVSFIGKYFPYLKMSPLPPHYPMSLHKDYKGEWNFNTKWKPIENFPAYLGWIRAIYIAQKELQKGLNISCPVLVLHADKSYKGMKWSDEVPNSDCVLDVEHIKKYAKVIGSNVTTIEIKNGMHDLVLSSKNVRQFAYLTIQQWLEKQSI
jgi:alpha-beta hydrolase superfamily lysophospholipase